MVAAFVLLSVVLAFLHTRFAGSWLLGIADRWLQDAAAHSISAARVQLRPFSLSVKLEDVVIKSLRSQDGPLLNFRAEALEIVADRSLLFSRLLHFRMIRITRPVIEKVISSSTDEPSLHPDKALAPLDSGQAMSLPTIRIDAFELIQGNLLVSGPGSHLHLTIGDIETNIRYDKFEKAYMGGLRIGSGRIATQGAQLEISEGSVLGRFSNGELIIDNMHVTFPFSKIDASGSVNFSTADPVYALKAETSLDSRELLLFLQQKLPISAVLKMEANLTGTGNAFSFNGKLESYNGRIADLDPVALNGSFRGDATFFELSSLSLQSTAGRIDSSALLSLDGKKPSSAKTTWRGVLLHHFSFLLPEALQRINTLTDGQITVESPTFTGPFTARGELSLAGVQCQFSGSMDPLHQIKSEISIKLDDIHQTALALGLTVPHHLTKQTAPIRIHGKITGLLDRLIVDVRLDADGISWDEPALSTEKIGADLKVTLENGVPQAFFNSRINFLPNPLTLSSVNLSGHLKKDEMSIDSLKLETESGSLTGSISVNTSSRIVQASAQGRQLPLALANTFMTLSTPITGRVDFLIEGRGHPEKPDFTLTMVLEDVATQGLHIPLIELNARSDHKTAQATLSAPSLGLRAEAGLTLENPYRIEGTVSINEPQINARFSYPILQPEKTTLNGLFSTRDMKLPPELLSRWPSLNPVSGSISGRFRLTGNPTALKSVSASLEIDSLSMMVAGQSIIMKDKAVFTLNKGLASLKNLILSSKDSELHLFGQISLSDEADIKAGLTLHTRLDHFVPPQPDTLFGGSIKAELTIDGPVRSPAITGRAEAWDLFLRLRDFPLTLTAISGVLDFKNHETHINGFKGVANGGRFTLNGRLNHKDLMNPHAGDVRLTLRNVGLSYPDGLRTNLDADLELNGPWNNLQLTGEARVLRGIFRRDIHPGVELINLARYMPEPSPEDIPAILRHLQLNFRLNSGEPLRIRNNLADIEMEARLDVSGSPAFPILSGRISNVGSGRALIGGRSYTVEKLLIDYPGSAISDFSIDVIAHTRLFYKNENFDIKLQLSGPMSQPQYTLSYGQSSEYPNLSQQDLAFLLLTGKMPSDLSGSAIDTLGGQMLSYFVTPFISPVTEGLKNLLKAEDVIIEPLIISSETDPGARFTFRKRVSDRAMFTYSADITRNLRHTWMLDYTLSRSLLLGAFSRDDGSYGASFKHTFQFGGGRPVKSSSISVAEERLAIGKLSWTGEQVLTEKQQQKLTNKLRPKRPFSHNNLQEAVERILQFYRKQGYANVTVTANLDTDNNDLINVTFHVQTGRPARFVFNGDPISTKLKKAVRDTWLGDFPESTNLTESQFLIQTALQKKRFFDASVISRAEPDENQTNYIFTVKRGRRYSIGSLVFSGGPLSEKALIRTVKTYLTAPTRSLWNLVIDRASALEALRRSYAELGYLKAEISPPLISPDPSRRRIDITLAIESGPQTLIKTINLSGHKALTLPELQPLLTLTTGSPFSPIRLQENQNALLSFYRSQGFGDVEISPQIIKLSETNNVDLHFIIKEGVRHTLANMEIRGNTRSSETFIRREAALTSASPISLDSLSRSKKRLYDSGAFKSVNITQVPSEAGKEGSDTVLIEVEEAPLFSAAYGLRYNSEEKLEGHGELSLNNLLGSGRRGFVSYRKSGRQSDLRLSLLAPYTVGLKLNTLCSLYFTEENRDGLVTATRGFTLQQSVRLPLKFSLSYFYRYNRIHSYYELDNDGPFPIDFTIKLSELGLALLRDGRDNRLNPKRGSYFSASLTYAPKSLGSDLPFISFFFQFTQTATIQRGLVWSGSLRLGLADAFDRDIIPSRRFYAGGGNSVRGFKLDSLGPRDKYLDRPTGGEATFIVNNELRFPLWGNLGAAVFYDLGNVFATIPDMNISDLRNSAGIGLRLNSPLGLLRLDLGFNLNPRDGEPRAILFFSLGQAF